MEGGKGGGGGEMEGGLRGGDRPRSAELLATKSEPKWDFSSSLFFHLKRIFTQGAVVFWGILARVLSNLVVRISRRKVVVVPGPVPEEGGG